MRFYIHRQGQNYGPYSKETLKCYLNEGLISNDDLVWRKGYSSWIQLKEMFTSLADEAEYSKEKTEN